MATLIHFHPKDTTILTAVKVLTLLNSNKKYFTGDEIYKIFHAPIKHPNIIKLMITSQADYPFFKRAYIYQLLTQSQRKDNQRQIPLLP